MELITTRLQLVNVCMGRGGALIPASYVQRMVKLIRQTNSDCIIEGGLLTQVQTHAMETLGSINLAVL